MLDNSDAQRGQTGKSMIEDCWSFMSFVNGCHLSRIWRILWISWIMKMKSVYLQERLWRQFIVNSTKITYNDTELLQLIYAHLMKKVPYFFLIYFAYQVGGLGVCHCSWDLCSDWLIMSCAILSDLSCALIDDQVIQIRSDHYISGPQIRRPATRNRGEPAVSARKTGTEYSGQDCTAGEWALHKWSILIVTYGNCDGVRGRSAVPVITVLGSLNPSVLVMTSRVELPDSYSVFSIFFSISW